MQWLDKEPGPLIIQEEVVRDAQVKEILTKDSEQPFDLKIECPLRLRLLQIREDKHILSVVAHHMAIDGWSIARLLEKTCDVYDAMVTGTALPAPPWEPYKKYITDYQQEISKPNFFKSQDYWRQKKFSVKPLLEKYEDKTAGHRAIYILNKKYYFRVKELAKHFKTTPFLFMMAVFLRALSRQINKKDFLISVPIAARDWDRAEYVIGNCVNLMPIEVVLTDNDDYAKDITQVKSAYVDAISHSLVPIQEIQSYHKLDLTQLHFNFEPSVEEKKMKDVEVDFYPYPIRHVEKPIIININDTKKTYYIEMDYQFQYLDLMKSLTTFTETERVINKIYSGLGQA